MNEDDDLIDTDLESFNLSPKSRSETRLERRNAAGSTIDLSSEINDSPLTHIFGASPTETVKFDSRQRRSSPWEDDHSERMGSSRLFSVKANVNRPREVEMEENETIPFIPDIDELEDGNSKLPEELPNIVVNKLISLQELEKDFIKHQAFSNLCGADSTILSSRLIAQNQVKEEDTPWTWDSLISEISPIIDPNTQGE